jgi:Fur family ferric uptake transcriptional regulator
MSQSPSPESLDDLRSRIRNVGLRATAPRIAVLRSLLHVATPQSHADMVERLAPEGWDRTTIYRNLTDLTEAGLVRRTDLGDHVWRFELRALHDGRGGADHPHFMCDGCGDILCLPDESVEIKPARGAPRALQRQRVQIQIRGRCDRCEEGNSTLQRKYKIIAGGAQNE